MNNKRKKIAKREENENRIQDICHVCELNLTNDSLYEWLYNKIDLIKFQFYLYNCKIAYYVLFCPFKSNLREHKTDIRMEWLNCCVSHRISLYKFKGGQLMAGQFYQWYRAIASKWK